MNKRCIVNFFSMGREDYKAGTERLIASAIDVGFKGDILVFSPDFDNEKEDIEYSDGNMLLVRKGYPNTKEYGQCKTHKEEPFLFKSHCFQAAKEIGYEEVMWADSSTLLLKNPEHYFEVCKEIGVVTFDNQGCVEATFTADDCLEQMGCGIEYARTFFQIEAFCLIFNFNHPRANLVFEDYIRHCNDGICLRGASGSPRLDYTAHRHDQSVLSYVLRKHYGIPINYGAWIINHDFMAKNGVVEGTFGKIGIAYNPYKREE